MKLSRSASYAIRAMSYLACSASADAPLPCKVLAAAGEMPPRFLLQILGNLTARGLLTSTRGTEGGYSLARKPSEISLLEIIEAVDGPMEYLLPFEDNFSPLSKAKLSQVLANITRFARQELKAISLEELSQAKNRTGQGGVSEVSEGA